MSRPPAQWWQRPRLTQQRLEAELILGAERSQREGKIKEVTEGWPASAGACVTWSGSSSK